MTILAVYTVGDSRNLETTGGRVPNRPANFEELYRRRATELARGGAVQGFQDIGAFNAWCALPENRFRFCDVRFVGHGNAGVFALAVNITGDSQHDPMLRPNGGLNFVTDADSIVRTLNQVLVSSAPSGFGASGAMGFVNVDIEACNVARVNLNAMAQAIALATGAPTTVAGYSAYIQTIWSGRYQRTAIMARRNSRTAPVDANQFRVSVNAH